MEKKKTTEIRICESEWHHPIELDRFEHCPRCGSQSCHKVIVLRDKNGN